MLVTLGNLIAIVTLSKRSICLWVAGFVGILHLSYTKLWDKRQVADHWATWNKHQEIRKNSYVVMLKIEILQSFFFLFVNTVESGLMIIKDCTSARRPWRFSDTSWASQHLKRKQMCAMECFPTKYYVSSVVFLTI